MRRALVWVAWCGCYAPTIGTDIACEVECPHGQVCIDNVCRSPDGPVDASTDGPADDVDGDGARDEVDNCPSIANADQHDEDGDLIGDHCDPCPHLAGTADDGDGDGVGDACDPEPTMARQRISFFDPFTSELPEWTLNNGVMVAGDQLRTLTGTAYVPLGVATAETRIVAAGSIGALGPISHQLAIQFGYSGPTYHYGEFYENMTGGSIKITKATGLTYMSIVNTPFPAPLPSGAWSMQIDASVAAQQIDLEARLGGVAYPPLTANTSSVPMLAAGNRITLQIDHAEVVVDYFLVIESTP